MDRGYEERLIAARSDRITNEEAGFPDEVKLFAASLMEMGEDPAYIAEHLDIEIDIIVAWHHRLMRQMNFALREDEFTFYRDKNVIRADARTRGCIVKGCLEENIEDQDAADLIGVTVATIKNWKVLYARDYNVMLTLPAGCEYKVKPTYVLGIAAKEELQELIFQHDREENTLASQRRMEYLQQRNG